MHLHISLCIIILDVYIMGNLDKNLEILTQSSTLYQLPNVFLMFLVILTYIFLVAWKRFTLY